MECHLCPKAKAVEAGKYRDKPFEKTPCANCGLVETRNVVIPFNTEKHGLPLEPGDPADGMYEDVHFPEELPPEPDEVLPLWVMREALATILSMPPEVRDAVCWRFGGMAFNEIARLQRVTEAAAEVRVKRALRRWPVLKALFAEKSAKQQRRKPYGGAG